MTKKKFIPKIKLGLLYLILIGLFAVTSCSHDEEYFPVTHKVVYKAEVSAGGTLTSASYNLPDAEPKPAANVSGTTWASPEVSAKLDLPVGKVSILGAVTIVKATGVNSSSTLKVQIYVDGILKKEVVATGQNLEATAQYNIEYKVN